MKLNAMITYFQMKDMIREIHIISDNEMYDAGGRHTIVSIKVAADDFKHAWIMYRTNGGTHAALVNADVFFSGRIYTTTDSVPDQVFIKNASIKELKNQLIGYDA